MEPARIEWAAPGGAAIPGYFGRGFGWLHPAQGRRGVVLCGPHGYEALCCHRPWARFAAALADAGLPTLRFDYPGCGDAPGSDEDPERIRAWIDGIRDAVTHLRARTGVTEIALVGLRFGATLAAAAAQELAAQGEAVAALVLLAPVATGDAYHKELRVLSMMAKSRGMAGDGSTPGLEAAGFHYTPATIAGMKALDPTRGGFRPADRILILDRNDATGGAALASAFRTLGAAVEQADFAGYGLLMRDAADSEYPAADFRRVVSWLHAGPAAAEPATTAAAPVAALPVPGGVERPVFVGVTRLFGILTEPTHPQPDRPVLLILNTGANHHIGTNRLSVLVARRLVREGVAVLRLDAGGIGDSPSRHGRPDQSILRPDMVTDVRQAVDWLAAHGYREIVVTGLCAGGWLAWHTTLAEPRITGQILLNLQNLWQKPSTARTFESNRDYLRLLRRRETWGRLFKGEVHVTAISRVLLSRVWEAVAARCNKLAGRVTGTETVADRTRRELGTLAARKVATAFVYVEADAGLDEMELHFGRHGHGLAAEPGATIVIIEQGDHLFSMKSSRDHVLELMAAQFTGGRFVPVAGPVPATPGWTPQLESQTA